MEIIESLDFHIEKRTAIAIGKFDGIHLGHQKLLRDILKKKEEGFLSVVFTFDPSPQVFFGGPKGQLMTKEEKRKAFEKMGVDILFEFPLRKETASIAPELFIKEYLVEKLNAGFIAAGPDLSFGDQGRGDYRLLYSKSKEYGYEVSFIDKVCANGCEISSTLVREKVIEGDMEAAEALLGQPYSIVGIVESGKQLGRTIDFPTLNLFPGEDKLLPPNGVYVVTILHKDEVYQGISNIGTRPTVSDSDKVSVETYVFDFEKDYYGEEIQVFFLKHTRPEMRFSGVDGLKAQLELDKAAGEQYFRTVRTS